jgi:ubiquinone/menaquinone biosynthesis C-methylase UbiE
MILSIMNADSNVLKSPDYGLDAPGVVRNLFVVAGVGLLSWALKELGFWSGLLIIPLFGLRFIFPLSEIGLAMAATCGFLGAWMVYESKLGKLRRRERLLNRLVWTGNEQVLDVGCGRGLMLVGAAKRLTTGRATGIDIWQAEDLTNNHAEAALENARREGVADRVDLKTCDMRRMPFPDASFDVVVSRAAIHNLYQNVDRAQAVSEIARVLKPGGEVLIDDIRHHHEYRAVLSQHGCAEIRRLDAPAVSCFLTALTMGSLRPATLLARKSPSPRR